MGKVGVVQSGAKLLWNRGIDLMDGLEGIMTFELDRFKMQAAVVGGAVSCLSRRAK